MSATHSVMDTLRHLITLGATAVQWGTQISDAVALWRAVSARWRRLKGRKPGTTRLRHWAFCAAMMTVTPMRMREVGSAHGAQTVVVAPSGTNGVAVTGATVNRSPP